MSCQPSAMTSEAHHGNSHVSDPWYEAIDSLDAILCRPRFSNRTLVNSGAEFGRPWLDPRDESCARRSLPLWAAVSELLFVLPSEAQSQTRGGRHLMAKFALVLLVALSASPVLARPPTSLGSLELPVFDRIITVAVNGQPLRLKVDLSGNGNVILNPGAAARAALTGTGKVTMNVGPVQLRGKTASPSFALSGATWSSKVMWFDLPYTTDADGVISPYHLPYNQIIFHMAGRGETTRFRLRMDSIRPGEFSYRSALTAKR